MNNKIFFGVLCLFLIGGIVAVSLFRTEMPEKQVHANNRGQTHELTVYKSPSCGCCGNWVGYMNGMGYKMEVINTENVEEIKEKYDIPKDLYACHTTIVNGGEYFIEGHIPNESIERLFEETPSVKGIAMAGMPSGSPGMPGEKEPFNIMKIDKTDQVSVFEVL